VNRSDVDNVRKLFDAKAETWTQKYAPGGTLEPRLQRFGRPLSVLLTPPASVLDFGCGTGDLARYLAAQGYTPTGCDIAPAMIERARELGPGIEWVSLSPYWRALPFEAASFNAVVASSVLEYLDDPGGVLRELSRVLAPGGVLLVTVPDPRHLIRRVERMARFALSAGPVARIAQRVPLVSRYASFLRLSKNRYECKEWLELLGGAGLHAAGIDRRRRPVEPLLLLSACRACTEPHPPVSCALRAADLPLKSHPQPE
jgi:SAM-dependent methyltransferase